MSILAIAANSKKASSNSLDNGATAWTSPLPRQVKINVDTAFCADQAEGAVGVVARDYKGQYIAAATRYLPHVASVAMAEALALKEGLTLANKLGCNSVIAESDSLETIQACSGEEHWWTDPAAIYADCIDLASSTGSVCFKHCVREANQTAHELARDSFRRKSSCNWDDELPRFILNCLVNDITEL
jgi:ribonuclease HI